MTSDRFVVGIDGGGTKTAAELCSLDGSVVASSHGGPSNFQVIGVDRAARTIVDLVSTCCHSVNCESSAVAAVVAGLTGAGRPGDQQRMAEGLKTEGVRRGFSSMSIAVESDARVALEGAFSGKEGIIVIAGTGSIVFGKNQQGDIHRAGGWGRYLSDEGSGYTIGKEAIRAVAKMMDGVGIKTSLATMLAKEFPLDTQEAIIHAMYKDNFDVASVVPVVLAAAEKKDKVATKILDDAAAELMGVIGAVALKLSKGRGKKKIPLSFIGSLISNENIYSKKLQTAIRKKLPGLVLREPEANPAHGAALMALRSQS